MKTHQWSNTMTDLNLPKRHPDNSNLSIWYEPTYRGLPLMAEKGPFFSEFLEDLWLTAEAALARHPRVFAARVDLRFPDGYGMPDDFVHNTAMSRFVDSFKEQIIADQGKSRREGKRVHPTDLFYFWVREVSNTGKPHYHFAFLLNEDSYHKLGNLEPQESNTFNRLQRAWARALWIDESAVKGLVNVPRNAEFSLRRGVGDPGFAAFFYRVSYFCKTATKVFIGQTRNRGCSRRR
ncbi:inovirus Gp2 family protein [Pseudomonas aeruginosa]|nr:inovirus Gp2 family protein [Pseudomonas aeruginosa]MCO2172138.1 inovirus Gp2 family protein [Pseudomonas aeruginosa]RQB62367.1 inovirus Gp2 family protein [Pseudomonas aeruginosa]TEC39908.1 inovirus Gp2 family protein [Pseudomonas aeruginosa]